MFISTDVLYGLHGDTVNINASIHSTSQVSIQWYRNGTLLNPASDDRYSVTSDSSQSVLTIHSFGEGLVGRYEIVVSNMEGLSSDGVRVVLPGESGGELEKGRRGKVGGMYMCMFHFPLPILLFLLLLLLLLLPSPSPSSLYQSQQTPPSLPREWMCVLVRG